MVTYLQLESEQVWHDQIVAPFMTSFLIVPLRQFYGLDANTCGAPGDNNHLYGRHRSANWDRQSRYCTNRSYGTTDARDHAGDQNWYRAVDIGIQGDTLHAACHRIDDAVRAGKLPEVAEWFGTFDGQTVVGWYEGHPSSSDSSHLYHMHVGVWTQFADDFQVMQRIYGVITGTTPAPQEDDMIAHLWRDTNHQQWYVTGPLQVKRAVSKAEADTIRYYASGPGLPGFTLVDLVGNPQGDADPAVIPGLDITHLGTSSGGGLTPEELAQVSGAAHDGAAGAIDGATVSSSVISIKKP